MKTKHFGEKMKEIANKYTRKPGTQMKQLEETMRRKKWRFQLGDDLFNALQYLLMLLLENKTLLFHSTTKVT